jgi:uncharacterized repeat protein (TIGR03803 family)
MSLYRALPVLLFSAALCACGGPQGRDTPASSSLSASRVLPALAGRSASTDGYSAIYAFQGTSSNDGSDSLASLVDVNGTLYGTTFVGGQFNFGTVFSISRSGKEHVLYSFANTNGSNGTKVDGGYPFAQLIYVNGTLYGTASTGGANGHGTVFSVTLDGTEQTVYSFQGYSPPPGQSDGADPRAGLVYANGLLYGTTYTGGNGTCTFGGGTTVLGCGTVFSVNASTGAYELLYSFHNSINGALSDGAFPQAPVIVVKGRLYGTTSQGPRKTQCDYGCGTVFALDPATQKYELMHEFTSHDGAYPEAGLTNVNGTLYGTAQLGGSTGVGDGCVFSIDIATHAESVVYAFKGFPDGKYPEAPLIDVNGTLYGTTVLGGSLNDGTVFSVTPSGTETIVQSMGVGAPGSGPYGGLIDVGGTLYGTTSAGSGSGNTDPNGTVFTLQP